MKSNLHTSHYLRLEFKLGRAIVLCLSLWFKMGNKWRHSNYFTWVRVDLNKKIVCFHLGPLSYFLVFLFVFVCLMFFFSCLTTRGFASYDVYGIVVSCDVFHDVFPSFIHGNVCLLLKVSFVHCNRCDVI